MGGLMMDRPVRKAHPPKLYRIGEVVDYSGMSRQTIHNYTVMGLLRESKWTQGGHRLYDESVFERLDVITALRRQHNSLDVIREQLEKFQGSQRQEDAPALG
jgi:DNA-binding transcriptional MerR regulator